MEAYPFPDVDTTDAQFARMFGRIQVDGVAEAAGSGALLVTQGGGMSVNVAAGPLFVRGLFARLATLDAPQNLAVSANTSGSTRHDRVVARLDPTAKTVTLTVLTGTPGAGVPPTLEATETGLYDVALARFPVAAGATVPGTIVDERQFAGGDLPAYSSTSRPAVGRLARIHYNTTTNVWEYWDGATYKLLVDQSALSILAAQISDPANLNVGKINGRRITVAATHPASPSINDVYIPGY